MQDWIKHGAPAVGGPPGSPAAEAAAREDSDREATAVLRGLDLNVKRQWVLEMLRWELGPVSAGVPVAGMPAGAYTRPLLGST